MEKKLAKKIKEALECDFQKIENHNLMVSIDLKQHFVKPSDQKWIVVIE